MTSINSAAVAPETVKVEGGSFYQKNKNTVHAVVFPVSFLAIVLTELAYRPALYDSPEFKTISNFNENMP